jgi:subtilisin family serine protease
MNRTIRSPLALTLVLGLAVGSTTVMARAAKGSARATSAASTADSRLSPVLATLGRPGVAALAPEARALRLGVSASGGGNLVFGPGGRVLVTARVAATGGRLLRQLGGAGGHVTFVDRSRRTVTLLVAPSSLDEVASVPGVDYLGEVLAPAAAAFCPVGKFVTEGVTQLDVKQARARYHVDGAGITIGILADSYNFLGGASKDVASGQLPGRTNPCGYKTPVDVLHDGGTTDEGRAMAQIVHAIAPAARIIFASGNGGQPEMAARILALARAGAKVIVDDVAYYDEPLYQQSEVAVAVDRVEAEGVSYFVAVGDSNKVVGGRNVGSYEGLHFRPATCQPDVVAADRGSSAIECNNFTTAGPADTTDRLTFAGRGNLQVILGWNEPVDGIRTELDLALVNEATGRVQALAHANNFASEQAFQQLTTQVSAGRYALVVIRYRGAGTPRFKFIMIHADNLSGVQFDRSRAIDVVGPTLFGHNAALGASSVASVPYYTDAAPDSFSSIGPAIYCYGPVQGVRAARPLVRCVSKQVDIAATDGGQNSFFGTGSPHRFWGTSAAAPHAAAVAALQLQYRPCASPTSVMAAQAASARRVGNFGPSAVGRGFLDAVTAVGDTKCGQRIAFAVLGGHLVGQRRFRAARLAEATSRLRVALWSATPAVCEVTRWGIVTLLAAGRCTIVASQAGNRAFGPASPVARSFRVSPASPRLWPSLLVGVV